LQFFINGGVNCQNAFDGTVNYNVLDIYGTVESPNQLLDARVICTKDSERNDRTFEVEQVSVYTVTLQQLNRENRRDSIAERTSLLLSDLQFCTHINSTQSYPLYLIEKMRFVRQPLTIRIINCDDRLRKMGSNVEKHKQLGTMLPSTIRAIVCGKTNVLISLLKSPHGVRFENVCIFEIVATAELLILG